MDKNDIEMCASSIKHAAVSITVNPECSVCLYHIHYGKASFVSIRDGLFFFILLIKQNPTIV